MRINAKLKMLICTRINNPHPIPLPPLPLKLTILSTPIEFISPIDETVIGGNRGSLSFREPDFKDRGMVPILQHHCAEIDVPVCGGGAVDYKWTKETFRVLEGEVGVVPGCAVAGSSETVCE